MSEAERQTSRVWELLMLLLLSMYYMRAIFTIYLSMLLKMYFYGNISTKFDCFMSFSYTGVCVSVHESGCCPATTYMCTHACLYLHVFVYCCISRLCCLRVCVLLSGVSSMQKHINIHKHI